MKLMQSAVKGLYGALAGLGILGVILCIAICLAPFILWAYGLILAFKASVILGVICFFIEPSYFIFGLVMFLADVNIPVEIVNWCAQHLQ